MGRLRPRLAAIMPSWLRVDRAMIFFRSISPKAARLAMSIVIEAVRRMRGLSGVWEREG